MRQMTVLVKPSSSLCNLKCEYCFYCDEVENRNKNSARIMDNRTSENLIKKVFDFCSDNSEITFVFQGGEPLIAGIDFFRRFVSFSENNKAENTVIRYSVQTNGTLINDEWCEFFATNDFLVGISLDGDRETHDKNRKTPDGNGTFNTVMNNISVLKRHNVAFNILSVITSYTDAKKLFDFYISNSFRSVQPIYCLDPFDGNHEKFSLNAKQLARFKKRFFNLWFSEISKGNFFYVRDFDNTLSLLTNGFAEQCGASGRCNAQLVVEADGTCYPCDFYCLDKFECPNINDVSGIMDILLSDGLKSFMNHEEPVNELCKTCRVASICGSGCKRYRYLYNQLPGYCPQMDFLLHAIDKLRNIT